MVARGSAWRGHQLKRQGIPVGSGAVASSGDVPGGAKHSCGAACAGRGRTAAHRRRVPRAGHRVQHVQRGAAVAGSEGSTKNVHKRAIGARHVRAAGLRRHSPRVHLLPPPAAQIQDRNVAHQPSSGTFSAEDVQSPSRVHVRATVSSPHRRRAAVGDHRRPCAAQRVQGQHFHGCWYGC